MKRIIWPLLKRLLARKVLVLRKRRSQWVSCRCGIIASAIIEKDYQGNSKGEAVIEFGDEASRRKALALSGEAPASIFPFVCQPKAWHWPGHQFIYESTEEQLLCCSPHPRFACNPNTRILTQFLFLWAGLTFAPSYWTGVS